VYVKFLLILLPLSIFTHFLILIQCFLLTFKIFICIFIDGKFEITEEDNVIVTGTVRVPNNVENEKICIDFDKFIDDKEEMSTKDIYKELKLRGYQYTGGFRSLKSASVTGKNGHITWRNNWVTFMDNMLQIMILGHNSRNLFVPTTIHKLIIDPQYHVRVIENLSIEERRKCIVHM
jgi:fatty acid synthase